MRLIDADKLLGKLDKRRGYIRKAQDEECVDRFEFDFLRARIAESLHVTEVVEKMAAAPVDPVKHAHWEQDEFGIYHCTRCGQQAEDAVKCDYFDEGEYTVPYLSAYCGECGARMDGGDRR